MVGNQSGVERQIEVIVLTKYAGYLRLKIKLNEDFNAMKRKFLKQ